MQGKDIAYEKLSKEEWMAMHYGSDNDHAGGIGASSVASILDVNPFQSKYELWGFLTGRMKPEEPSLPMECGHALEPVVARKYKKKTDRDIFDPGPHTIVRHPNIPYLYCTPDRIVRDPITKKEVAAVELKTSTMFGAAGLWRDGNPPIANMVQLQIQLAVMGFSWGSLACVVENREFFHIDIPANKSLVADILYEIEKFWKCVVDDTPPPPDASESTRRTIQRIYPEDDGTALMLTGPSDTLLGDYMIAQAEAKAADERKKGIYNNIIADAKEASYLFDDKGTVFSYKTQVRKGSIRLDLTDDNRLALDTAKLAYKVTKPSESRVLRAAKKLPDGVTLIDVDEPVEESTSEKVVENV